MRKMDEWKMIALTTDRGAIEIKGKIRQSNWCVIIETEEG
jgi:hypothetical protein